MAPIYRKRNYFLVQLVICSTSLFAHVLAVGRQSDVHQMGERAAAEAEDDLREIMSEFWSWRLREVPEFASSVGVHDYDDRLETFTLEAFSNRKLSRIQRPWNVVQKYCSQLSKRLDAIDIKRLDRHDVINVLVLRHDLQTYIRGYDTTFYSSLNPVNNFEGVHRDFTYWVDSMEFETETSFVNYTNRLRALVTQIHEQINLMKVALRSRFTYHRLSVDKVEETIRSVIEGQNAVSTVFFKPFNNSLDFAVGVSRHKAEKFRQEGTLVIQDHVLPAYRKLAHFFQHEYLPKTRPTEGIGWLSSAGTQLYESCLRWYLSTSTATDVSASAVHRLGRDAVANILARVDQVIQLTIRQKVAYNGALEDFMKYANGASKLFYRTEEEMLAAYREIVYEKIPRKMSRLFHGSANCQQIHVERMPFDGPAGVLMETSSSDAGTEAEGGQDEQQNHQLSNSAAAIFFVNVRQPLTRPKWQMHVTALHETMPGRHLLACYARNQSLPSFRRWREYRKMYSVPFQFPFHSAYTEGWALYAESLGHELGLFDNPFIQFGQLHSELYRACEMVVDTGIHAYRWSAEDAVDYLVRISGVSRSKAEFDVRRIITFPGQAVAPEYAHLKFIMLRRLARFAIGDGFDIREFHEEILRLGPVPMHVLELALYEWIRTEAGRSCASDAFTLSSALVAIALMFCWIYCQLLA